MQRKIQVPEIAELVLLSLVLALLGAFALGQVSHPTAFASGSTFTVDRTDDVGGLACSPSLSNDCSLRSAIQQANAGGTNNSIRFDSSVFGSGPTTITLSSGLPIITSNGTWIDGQTMLPRIDGISLSATETGIAALTISASYVTLSNIAIINMPSSDSGGDLDIYVAAGTHNQIAFNYLGVVPGQLNCTWPGVTRAAQESIQVGGSVTGSSGLGNGSVYIYGNVIGCHRRLSAFVGIHVLGANYVYIGEDASGNPFGNWIGSQPSGSGSLGNGNGIVLRNSPATGGTRYSVVRNNSVRNNTGFGIQLLGTGTNNTSSTYMNTISANSISGNGLDGISLSSGAFWNQIGGTLEGGDNHIYSNSGNGITIGGSSANGILGNYIGTNGTIAEGNSLNGILIDNSSGNSIGSFFSLVTTTFKANVISGNTQDGIRIVNMSSGNIIQGNSIGTNAAMTGTIPNRNGISVLAYSNNTLIGGTTADSGNYIAGNLQEGVLISDTTTFSNTVQMNKIGLGPAGRSLPNGGSGILLSGGTQQNLIGSLVPGIANYIGDNNHNGIHIAAGAHDNTVGINLVMFNQNYGVLLEGASTRNNLITFTVVGMNGYDGIAQRAGTGSNRWSKIGIYSNFGLGINKLPNDTPNGTPHAPFAQITSINVGTHTISGTAAPSAVVELYVAEPDPTGYGEGVSFIANTTANGAGQWSLNNSEITSCRYYTAFYTSEGQSTEFGKNQSSCLYLPLITK